MRARLRLPRPQTLAEHAEAVARASSLLKLYPDQSNDDGKDLTWSDADARHRCLLPQHRIDGIRVAHEVGIERVEESWWGGYRAETPCFRGLLAPKAAVRKFG